MNTDNIKDTLKKAYEFHNAKNFEEAKNWSTFEFQTIYYEI